MKIKQADLDNWFVYHAPRPGQQKRYVEIRDAAKRFAEVIVANTAGSADQSAAVRFVRQAVMTANQGIACEDESTSAQFAAELGE